MDPQKKYVLCPALAAWAVTAALVWFAPIAFCGYQNEDRLGPLWLALSNSASAIGSAAIVVIIGMAIARRRDKIRGKVLSFLAFALPVGLTLGGVAYVNEQVVKPWTGMPRPSHEYLESKGVIPIGLSAFYDKGKEDRRRYLEEAISRHGQRLQHVRPAVLRHWAVEAGFSFPSGHSLNAFLFGTVLAYLFGMGKRRWLCLLPLSWAALVCLSRAALGLHSPLDVSAGGAAGLLLAAAALVSGYLDYLPAAKGATHKRA